MGASDSSLFLRKGPFVSLHKPLGFPVLRQDWRYHSRFFSVRFRWFFLGHAFSSNLSGGCSSGVFHLGMILLHFGEKRSRCLENAPWINDVSLYLIQNKGIVHCPCSVHQRLDPLKLSDLRYLEWFYKPPHHFVYIHRWWSLRYPDFGRIKYHYRNFHYKNEGRLSFVSPYLDLPGIQSMPSKEMPCGTLYTQ